MAPSNDNLLMDILILAITATRHLPDDDGRHREACRRFADFIDVLSIGEMHITRYGEDQSARELADTLIARLEQEQKKD